MCVIQCAHSYLAILGNAIFALNLREKLKQQFHLICNSTLHKFGYIHFVIISDLSQSDTQLHITKHNSQVLVMFSSFMWKRSFSHDDLHIC